SLFDMAAQRTFETQLAFTHTVNLMNLMASANVLEAIEDLVSNYNDPNASDEEKNEKQWPIINNIIYGMRSDVTAADCSRLKNYQFPIIVTDIPPTKPPNEHAAKKLK